MNTTARGDRPQWVCFACDRPTLVISARVHGRMGSWAICPICQIRYGASPEFEHSVEDRVKAADAAMVAELLGITPAQFIEAAQACGPDLAKFKAHIAERRA